MVTKLHLTDQYYWSASIIDKKFQITDFIYQYLIQHTTNGTEVCFITSGLQLFSMPMQLNILCKLHITITVFPNTQI